LLPRTGAYRQRSGHDLINGKVFTADRCSHGLSVAIRGDRIIGTADTAIVAWQVRRRARSTSAAHRPRIQ
jgi:hypothetical protein